MTDFYFSEYGDLKIGPNGDIAVADTQWRDDVQQAYLRIRTEPGDFVLYPGLGAELQRLFGRPQTERTGDIGKAIILEALNRENRFSGRAITIKAIPTGPQTIRFDVFIVSGSRSELLLTVEQELGVT